MWFGRQKKPAASENTGARGETLAAEFLRKKGYKIIARNLRPDGHEELDILCESKGYRVFVEVKTRTQNPAVPSRYGTPATAVTHEKRRHLLSAAHAYGEAHPTKKIIRMDIVEVYLTPNGEVAEIHHMEDAFRS